LPDEFSLILLHHLSTTFKIKIKYMSLNQNDTLAQKASKRLLPLIEKYYRTQYKGLDNIPDEGFLGVGNHLGVYFIPESYLWLGKYHTLKGKPPMKVLVHSAFKQLINVFRMNDESLGILDANPKNAIRSLQEGNAVTVYPGGDRENTKPFSQRNTIDFFGHYGYIRTALKAGVPILPVVGIGGGETLFVLSSGQQLAKRSRITKMMKLHSWPIYWSFPFGWHIGHLPNISLPLPSQITISVLPPIYLADYTAEDANDEAKLEEINERVTSMMQIEMNLLAKGRIPFIGKLPKNTFLKS
jgi:1-acyl-sn-glycerol-3-phosphate acyltransferase